MLHEIELDRTSYRTKVQGSGKVISGSQGEYGKRRGSGHAKFVDDRQDPASGPVTPTSQNSQIGNFAIKL